MEPEGEDELEDYRSRLLVREDEVWDVVACSVHQIQAAVFIQCGVSEEDINKAIPSTIKSHAEKGLDHLRAKDQLRKAARSVQDDFLQKRMLPFTVYVRTFIFWNIKLTSCSHTFLKGCKTPEFIAAIQSQSRAQLDIWFDRQLTPARARWFMTPFEKGVNFDYILHPTARSDAREEARHKNLVRWIRLLISSTAVDIYRYLVQMKAGAEEPNKLWVAVTTNFSALPTTPEGQLCKVNWAELPAAANIEVDSRASNRPKRNDTNAETAGASRQADWAAGDFDDDNEALE